MPAATQSFVHYSFIHQPKASILREHSADPAVFCSCRVRRLGGNSSAFLQDRRQPCCYCVLTPGFSF
ncbi:unnamed protein product [Calypogeia fissa]